MTTEPDVDGVDVTELGWYVTIAAVGPPAANTTSHPTTAMGSTSVRTAEFDPNYGVPAPSLAAVVAYSTLTDPLEAVQHACDAMRSGLLPRVGRDRAIRVIASDTPPWFEDEA